MNYIATFFSHFGAIRFKKMCDQNHHKARIMPVPRDLSSSCGTCVRYSADTFYPGEVDSEELEQIVEVNDSGYEVKYRAKDC